MAPAPLRTPPPRADHAVPPGRHGGPALAARSARRTCSRPRAAPPGATWA